MKWAPCLSGLVAVAVLLLILANTSKVYAAPTVLVSPSVVTKGSNFQVSGTGFSTSDTGSIQIYTDQNCGFTLALVTNVGSDSSGNVAPVTFSSTSLSVGQHCALLVLSFSEGFSIFTVAPPPIPEYPLGLPIFAIFTAFAYAILRRRTTTKT